MPETQTTRADEDVVRTYLTALNNGQILEALNTFSLDARLRDETGRERHGIREIAESFVARKHPVKVDIEDLETRGDTVAVRVRMMFPEGREAKVYRSLFRVSRDRIRSLEIHRVPA